MKAVVTGASGEIGSAIARDFAKRGFGVALVWNKNEEAAKALASELAQYGEMIVLKKIDFAKSGAETALSELEKEFGAPDVLVNAAGISRAGLVLDLSEEEWDEVFRVNVRSVFLTSKWAANLMRGGGRIVNVSSIWGSRSAPCEAAYAASKAAVESFTKSFAAEVGSLGITVNAVAPGLIDTKMNSRLTEEEKRDFVDKLAIARIGEPADVAAAVCFLASEEASYITGQILEVSGGLFD